MSADTVTTWGLSPTAMRTARKAHHCWGCDVEIVAGERYAEYLGESAGFQNGHRYHVACAYREGILVDGERPIGHRQSCRLPWNLRSERDARTCECGGEPVSYFAEVAR